MERALPGSFLPLRLPTTEERGLDKLNAAARAGGGGGMGGGAGGGAGLGGGGIGDVAGLGGGLLPLGGGGMTEEARDVAGQAEPSAQMNAEGEVGYTKG